MSIRAFGAGGREVAFQQIIFPGGEPHIAIDKEMRFDSPVLIDARVGSAQDFLLLLLLTDALRHRGATHIALLLPYFPGGRQDRVEPGSGYGFTAKMYADILNQQGYSCIYTVDPHSDVTTALLRNYALLDPFVYLAQYLEGKEIDFLICPDAGAEKRTYKAAQRLGKPVVHARKVRDVETGRLSGFHVDPLPGAVNAKRTTNYLVVDDLCDGGGTFLGLAEKFREDPKSNGCSLHLWVTHGIFSRGYEDLLFHYETIGATDAYPGLLPSDRLTGVHIIPILGPILPWELPYTTFLEQLEARSLR